MNFSRVIPRDLFNESKLLKCLGTLALRIHEGQIDGLEFEHTDIDKGFIIEMDEGDGSLYCTNLVLMRTDYQTEVYIRSNYNSKEPFPLVASCFKEECVDVFTDEFRKLVTN